LNGYVVMAILALFLVVGFILLPEEKESLETKLIRANKLVR
jgi:hypothetical protein